MRITRALPFLIAAVTFGACGSSSTKKNPDAKPAADAKPLFDANITPDAAAGVTGLGMVCNPSANPTGCGTDAPNCDALTQGATQGFCSLSCGQSAWNNGQPTAPTGGTQMCATAYKGPAGSGTPVCALYAQDQTDTTKADWDCAIACGTFNGQALGGCPGGLSCMLQTGQTYGFCL